MFIVESVVFVASALTIIGASGGFWKDSDAVLAGLSDGEERNKCWRRLLAFIYRPMLHRVLEADSQIIQAVRMTLTEKSS